MYLPSFYLEPRTVSPVALQLSDERIGTSYRGNRNIPFTFPTKPTIYMKNTIAMEYKRQYRDLPDEVKQKISASTKGKS